MRFVQIGLPNTQTETSFTSVLTDDRLPYQSLWWLRQSPNRAGTIRFVPDLSIHLVFDVSGLLAVEPQLIHTGLTYVDLHMPAGVQVVGMQFAVWETLWLRAESSAASAISDVSFDADWARLLYFTLLDARNAQLSSDTTLDRLARFKDWIDATLPNEPLNLHFRLAARAGAPPDLTYSARHQRRLYHELTGMSPVQFKRIVRLQQTLQQIRAERALTWDRYYDQAHLTREFKDLIGLTPAVFLKHYCG